MSVMIDSSQNGAYMMIQNKYLNCQVTASAVVVSVGQVRVPIVFRLLEVM